MKRSVGYISQGKTFAQSFWLVRIVEMGKLYLLPYHLLFIVAWSVGYIELLSTFAHFLWLVRVVEMGKFYLFPFHLLFIVAWSVGDIEQLSTFALSLWFVRIVEIGKFYLLPFHLLRSFGYISQESTFDGKEFMKWSNLFYCHFICYLSLTVVILTHSSFNLFVNFVIGCRLFNSLVIYSF